MKIWLTGLFIVCLAGCSQRPIPAGIYGVSGDVIDGNCEDVHFSHYDVTVIEFNDISFVKLEDGKMSAFTYCTRTVESMNCRNQAADPIVVQHMGVHGIGSCKYILNREYSFSQRLFLGLGLEYSGGIVSTLTLANDKDNASDCQQSCTFFGKLTASKP